MNQCIPKESDLQSDAFDRSATSACKPKERFELSTYCLQNSCSDQLSYFGICTGASLIYMRNIVNKSVPIGRGIVEPFIMKWSPST